MDEVGPIRRRSAAQSPKRRGTPQAQVSADAGKSVVPAVEQRLIESLRPNPHNPRTHSRSQLRKIADSIKAFGFLNPLLIADDGMVIAGHGRLEAAKQAGLKSVPVIDIRHLTPAQLRAYVIADNRLAELAGWDRNALALELEEIGHLELGFDIETIGFDAGEIEVLIGELHESPKASGSADEIPAPGPPVSQLGDLWKLGAHRIFCGNSLDDGSYSQVLGGKAAAVIFTDPPYNVRIEGHASGLGQIKHREFGMASGEMSTEEFTRFLKQVMQQLVRHSRTGSVHYLCMDWRHAHDLLNAGLGVYGPLLNICVWAKDNAGMGSFYRSQHELVFVFKNGRTRHRNNVRLGQYGRNRTNIWRYPGVNAFARSTDEGRLAELHPTIKPVALIADAILDCSSRGELVLDPFLGSGSTLIAAERVGRVCCGIELDAAYVDTAVRRWQRHTGESAVHAVSGKRFDESATQQELRSE